MDNLNNYTGPVGGVPPIVPFAGVASAPPVIPKLYWDAYSDEQRIKTLWKCFGEIAERVNQLGYYYVPTFAGEWDATKQYPPLTVVSAPAGIEGVTKGDSYTAVKWVPVGTQLTNAEYWALTGNYNAQIAQLQDSYNNLVTEKVYYSPTAMASDFTSGTVFFSDGFRERGDGGNGYYVACEASYRLATATNNGYVAPLNDDVINVMQVGGYNNGVDNNSSVYQKITNYLNTLTGYFDSGQSIGKTIYFPAGTYYASQPFELPKPYGENATTQNVVGNFKIVGADKNTTQISNPNGTECITVRGAFCTISNITVMNAEIGIHFYSGAYESKLEDVVFMNCSDSGLKTEQSFYLSTIKNCYALKCGTGFNIQYNATSLLFSNCYANACSSYGYAFGIVSDSVNGLRYSTLESCACDDTQTAYYFGPGTYGCTLNGCGCESITKAGIRMVGGSGGACVITLNNFFAAFITGTVHVSAGANCIAYVNGLTVIGSYSGNVYAGTAKIIDSCVLNSHPSQDSIQLLTSDVINVTTKVSTSPVALANIVPRKLSTTYGGIIIAVCKNNAFGSSGNVAIYMLAVRCSAGTYSVNTTPLGRDGSGVNTCDFTFTNDNGTLMATNSTESSINYAISLYAIAGPLKLTSAS